MDGEQDDSVWDRFLEQMDKDGIPPEEYKEWDFKDVCRYLGIDHEEW